jgi:hypothetical protein
MKNRFFASSLIAAALALGVSTNAQGQLLGGSGLLGIGNGSLLGGGLGKPLGLLSSGSPVSGLLGGVTGTLGGVVNTTQSTLPLASTVNTLPVLKSATSSLLGGLDAFTQPSADVSSLLTRFDSFGFPGTSSVYAFPSNEPTSLLGAGVGATSGLSSASSPFFFGWTPAGYVTTFSNPVLRNFGPLGSLLNPTQEKSATRPSR